MLSSFCTHLVVKQMKMSRSPGQTTAIIRLQVKWTVPSELTSFCCHIGQGILRCEKKLAMQSTIDAVNSCDVC